MDLLSDRSPPPLFSIVNCIWHLFYYKILATFVTKPFII